MFVVADLCPTPAYIAGLYRRLPAIPKKLVHVDGSVYWMLPHPRQAAALVSDWLTATLPHAGTVQPTAESTVAAREKQQG